MPQELPPHLAGSTSLRVKALPSSSPTERFILHAWVLVILGALLWLLLS